MATVDEMIRPATPDDVDAVAHVWHDAWFDGHAGNVPDELLAHRNPEAFIRRTRDRIDSMWVAEHDGAVVGFTVVHGDEVDQLFVDRSARGTGVAAALLRQAEDAIRSAGHGIAWLAVVPGNSRARAFYEREGWRDAGTFVLPADTADGTIEVPSHRYEIDLVER